MSVLEANEFEQLIAALMNREITPDQRVRLDELAAADAARQGELRDTEALLGALDRERATWRLCVRGVEPGEQADPAYRAAARAAARAEHEIRQRVALGQPAAPPLVVTRRVLTWRDLAIAVAAAAAVLVAALLLRADDAAPPMDGRTPGEQRLDVPLGIVVVAQQITAQSRALEWRGVPDARIYDARVLDTEGRVVLARPDEQARSTRWELNEQEYRTLSEHRGALRLRVGAFDDLGFRIASSVDHDLVVR